MHRPLRILATALITAGLVIALDVGLTLAWKEPLSSLYGAIQQEQVEDQLEELERDFPGAADLRSVAGSGDLEARVGGLADRFAGIDREAGSAIGRLEIPEIDLDAVFVEGTDTASLRRGPGHFTRSDSEGVRAQGDGSNFPGQGGTAAIAGHRTTYSAPFRRINELDPGNEIVVRMPYATFTYEVQKLEIVDPSAIGVVRNVGYERLVLTACHPLYSAAQRIISFAKLKEINVFDSGARIWQDP